MKIDILTLLILGVTASACNRPNNNHNQTSPMEGNNKSMFVFTPDQVIIKNAIDTIEVSANMNIYITGGNNYPLGHEGIIDNPIIANHTYDTLKADWLKAVALNDVKNKNFKMKVITLDENNSERERSYCIDVGLGPSFGTLIVTQKSQ